MIRYGGMQLLPVYKRKLKKDFLAWYEKSFLNRRMGYGHWTAGRRTTNSEKYHKVILADPYDASKAEVVENRDVRCDMHTHTFGRNANSWSICMAGMLGATTSDLGNEVPTPAQCRLFVEETARICVNLRQPVSQLMCHHEAADNIDQGPNPPYPTPRIEGPDSAPYGPMSDCLRWDIWVRIDPRTLQWYPPLGDFPREKTLWFADWWRGETILLIQKLTAHVWKPN